MGIKNNRNFYVIGYKKIINKLEEKLNNSSIIKI